MKVFQERHYYNTVMTRDREQEAIKEILQVLKENKVSLMEARYLFDRTLYEIEKQPLNNII